MTTVVAPLSGQTEYVRPFRLRSVPDPAPTPSAPADALMVRVARGDEQAFSALYDELGSLVYGVVVKTVRDPAIAEEVTQEVFVEIWRIAARFDASKGGARSWAATVAHRRAVDRVRSEDARRRREQRDHEHNAVVDRAEAHDDEVADIVTASLDQTRVRDALDELTPTQRDAITLAYFGGRTYREVAVLLDIPEGTAKTRIRDGLIRLRDTMGVTR